MTTDQLIKQISATMGKAKVVKLSSIISEHQFYIRDLIDLSFYPDKNIAFRAAWLLENVFLHNPESYLDDLAYLIGRMNDVKYPSCKRHYAKIMMHLTSAKAPENIQNELATLDLEPIVEQFFDWLIDPKVLIAVKVFAAEALFNLRHRYPWLTEELSNQLQFLMRNGTAAIQVRGRKLLALLSCEL